MALKDEPITANTSTKRPISAIAAGATAMGAAQAEADNQNLMAKPIPEGAPAAPSAPKALQDLSEPWSKANKDVGDTWAPKNAAQNDTWAVHYGQQEAAARQQAVAPAANPNTLPADAMHKPETRGF